MKSYNIIIRIVVNAGNFGGCIESPFFVIILHYRGTFIHMTGMIIWHRNRKREISQRTLGTAQPWQAKKRVTHDY